MQKKFSIDPIFIILGLIHFYIVNFIFNKPNFINFNVENICVFTITKILTFILIIGFYQLFPYVYKEFKNNNSYVKKFVKYFSIYFLINFVVLVLIWPGLHHAESLHIFLQAKDYSICYFWHWLTALDILLGYNIIPALWGISLFNIFLYSLIVAHVILGFEKYFTKKYSWLLFIPFCVPIVLIFNTCPIRLVISVWVAVLLFSTLLFLYGSSDSNKIKHAVSIGILASVFTLIRSENLPLALILPLMVLSLKLFDKKKFITFLLTFLISFAGIYIIQKSSIGLMYELHNLAFIYEDYEKNNVNPKELEKVKPILNSVFVDFETKGHRSEVNCENKDDCRVAFKILLKMLVERSPHYIKKNIKDYQGNPIIVCTPHFIPDSMSPDKFDIPLVKKYVKPLNPKLQYNFITYAIYAKPDYFPNYRYFNLYNPLINYSILLFLLALGVVKRNRFYIWYFVLWNAILVGALATMPWSNYLYLFAFSVNTYLMLTVNGIMLLNFLSTKFKQNNKAG